MHQSYAALCGSAAERESLGRNEMTSIRKLVTHIGPSKLTPRLSLITALSLCFFVGMALSAQESESSPDKRLQKVKPFSLP